MKKVNSNQQLPPSTEHVRLSKPIGRSLFRLLAFLICTAVLIAAFAVSGIWSSFGTPVKTFFAGIFHRDRVTEQENEQEDPSDISDANTKIEQPSNGQSGVVSIVSKRLKEPNQAEMSAMEESFSFESPPQVFIYCSNPTEAYLAENQPIPEGMINEAAFRQDSAQTVCAVAQKLRDILSEKGVVVTYQLPEQATGYLGSTERAKKLICSAIEENRGISLVVEIGRDSLFDSEGNYIRTQTENENEPMAQVLAVVGSGEVGTSCPSWQENLKLAKVLQATAEEATPGIFRGIRIKPTSQNQQFTPLALSLVVGSGANSVGEAMRTAEQIGNALSKILLSS